MGDILVDDENITNYQEPYHDDNVEEAPHEPPVEHELRRFTRERQFFQRYLLHEYVMITNSGEPKYYQEAI